MRVVGCLGECSARNVCVAIRRSRAGRTTTWFGSTHLPAVRSALEGWIADGALPGALDPELSAVAFERGLGCAVDQLPMPTLQRGASARV